MKAHQRAKLTLKEKTFALKVRLDRFKSSFISPYRDDFFTSG